MKTQQQISVTDYKSSGFIGDYQRLVKDVVIPYQHSVLWDRAENIEKSHVVQNFLNAGRALRGEDVGDGFYGMAFQDSDAGKWLEAAAYSLAVCPDEELEKKADELIEIIKNAQDEDGYLNTYFTVKDKDKRWTNLLEAHELYCSGHMIEAGVAYYEATGKRTLLDVVIKNAEHIYKRFVTEDVEGYSGHPEIELALLRLYDLTKNSHFLELAQRFVDQRGVDPSFFAREKEKRDWTVWGSDPWDNDYRQNSAPVRKQTEAVGHAVRAVYLYTSMAQLSALTDDAELFEACKRLWQNIIHKKMYLTGGIGSTVIGEAFTVNYDLPQDTAYAETCASIGLMFFASRMLENEISNEYGDVMELAFYNTVLAGMQLDGKRFFYVNPLEINPEISGKTATHGHTLPQRPKWYACACCPPNVARLVESFGKYAYGENEKTAFCHMYASGEVNFKNGLTLSCETGYPYDMTVKYSVKGNGEIAIRVPCWSKKYSLKINGKVSEAKPVNGYLCIDVNEKTDIELTLDGTPRFVRATNKIPRLSGMKALMRGTLVYCFEGADNENVRALKIDPAKEISVEKCRDEILGNVVRLVCNGEISDDSDEIYTSEPEQTTPCRAVAVPYYTWGNRGENQMRVWVNSK